MRPLIGSLVLVVALLLVAGQGETVDAAGRALPMAATIESDIQSFILQSLTVTEGDTINWTNRDAAPHTSTSGSSPSSNGIWDSNTLSINTSFSFTFDTVGSFPYFCKIHPSMQATITVQPAATPTPVPTPTPAPTPTPVPTPTATPLPTVPIVGEWGILALAGLVAGILFWQLRRRGAPLDG